MSKHSLDKAQGNLEQRQIGDKRFWFRETIPTVIPFWADGKPSAEFWGH